MQNALVLDLFDIQDGFQTSLRLLMEQGAEEHEIRDFIQSAHPTLSDLYDALWTMWMEKWGNDTAWMSTVSRLLIEYDSRIAKAQTEQTGETLLHVACMYDAPFEIVELLIRLNPNSVGVATNFLGETPLHLALQDCSSETLSTVKLLLASFPDGIKMKNFLGRLPIHYAVERRNGFATKESLSFLIEKYPDGLRIQDNRGRLPLHLGLGANLKPSLIQLLIEAYPLSVRWEATALFLSQAQIYCTRSDRKGLAVKDSAGRIPLHYASFSSFHEHKPALVRSLLLQYPEGTRVVDKKGRLPLHDACFELMQVGIGTVNTLLKTDKFSILEASHDGRLPLQHAFDRRDELHPRASRESITFLLEKQDEALGLLHDAFQPFANLHGLPTEVVKVVWSFVRPTPWRPTSQEMEEIPLEEQQR